MIERDRFGSVLLVRSWGRIGTIGKELVQEFASEAEAQEALEAIARTKRRRGYQDLRAPPSTTQLLAGCRASLTGLDAPLTPQPLRVRSGGGLCTGETVDRRCGSAIAVSGSDEGVPGLRRPFATAALNSGIGIRAED
jgi:predicted DNA-binding WGR domain protein